jgi:hypothetical protein
MDRISAAASPVPISYIRMAVLFKFFSFVPSKSTVLLLAIY